MLKLRPAIVAAFLATSALTAISGPALAQSCTCGGVVGIRAEDPPPPMPEYDQPPLPSPGYLWTPGYWSYNNEDYYWVPGTWVEPPRPGVLWTPGYWAFTDGVYAFNRGYWGPHVGFYGGISYGFGYGGSGYQGGRWDDGRFFYNSSVNNVRNVHITNVYNETVINNASSNRASFNGGTGGIAAKPTAEELAAAHEPHEKPTIAQVEHVHAASTSPTAFATTNHGRPLVAATAKPGALTGPGVVKAKPAEAMTAPGEKPKGEGAPPKELPKGVEKPLADTPLKPEPAHGAEKPMDSKLKPELKGEPKPELKGEPKPEFKGGPKPELKAEPKLEPKAAPRLEPKAEPMHPVEKPVVERPKLEQAPRPAFAPHPAPAPQAPRPVAEPKRPPAPERHEGGGKCGHPGEPKC